MPINIRTELQQVWDNLNRGKNDISGNALNFDLDSKLVHFVQVGDYYYFVNNIPTLTFDYLSPEASKILGYPLEQLTLQSILGMIHPEDLPYFFDFEARVADFFNKLPVEKILRYKTRYDYRIKKADGNYLRVMQQILTIEHGADGAIIRTLGIHTDITHLKQHGKPMLSIIGLDNEPSYIDLQVKSKFIPTQDKLRKREKDILHLLIAGKANAEIADILNISRLTVETHRKNMLKRLNLNSSAQLVAKAIQDGWV
jgi:DNA-binding CsgD family transcriptional regulator